MAEGQKLSSKAHHYKTCAAGATHFEFTSVNVGQVQRLCL